jgi:hypothetical protein
VFILDEDKQAKERARTEKQLEDAIGKYVPPKVKP